MKKRIFIIQNTPLNEPLPLSVYLTSLLENFSKNKMIEINLIIGNSKNIPSTIKELCNKIYQFKGSTYSIKDNLKFSLYVNRILKEENIKSKISIVHCLYPNSSLLGAVIFKNFSNKRVKIIYDIRSPWIEMSIERGFISPKISKFYKYFLYKEEKFLGRFVEGFVFITNGLSEHYKKIIKINKSQKIYISPSGVDLKKFKKVKTNVREVYKVKSKEVLIGSVGGIAKIRKLDKFIDIFKGVVQKNKNVKLMFVGEGDASEDLKLKIKKLNLEGNIIFTGKIHHKEIPKYISAFDFGLCHLPNIFVYENSIPLKILEYLSCKVQVLASELKAHREMSEELDGIYIYKNAQDVLKVILKNKELKENIKKYGWDEIANNYEGLWR